MYPLDIYHVYNDTYGAVLSHNLMEIFFGKKRFSNNI